MFPPSKSGSTRYQGAGPKSEAFVLTTKDTKLDRGTDRFSTVSDRGDGRCAYVNKDSGSLIDQSFWPAAPPVDVFDFNHGADSIVTCARESRKGLRLTRSRRIIN